MAVETERRVMTAPEVARVLRVHPNTVYEYCHRGLIPHVRLTGRILIPRDRFEAWLAGADKRDGDKGRA